MPETFERPVRIACRMCQRRVMGQEIAESDPSLCRWCAKEPARSVPVEPIRGGALGGGPVYATRPAPFKADWGNKAFGQR